MSGKKIKILLGFMAMVAIAMATVAWQVEFSPKLKLTTDLSKCQKTNDGSGFYACQDGLVLQDPAATITVLPNSLVRFVEPNSLYIKEAVVTVRGETFDQPGIIGSINSSIIKSKGYMLKLNGTPLELRPDTALVVTHNKLGSHAIALKDWQTNGGKLPATSVKQLGNKAVQTELKIGSLLNKLLQTVLAFTTSTDATQAAGFFALLKEAKPINPYLPDLFPEEEEDGPVKMRFFLDDGTILIGYVLAETNQVFTVKSAAIKLNVDKNSIVKHEEIK